MRLRRLSLLLDDALSKIKTDVTSDDFGSLQKRGGVIINSYNFKIWLESYGFYKYYPGEWWFIFVRVVNNLIENTSEERLDFIVEIPATLQEFKVYEHMASSTRYFKEDFLNILDSKEIVFKDDTQDDAYIYFRMQP